MLAMDPSIDVASFMGGVVAAAGLHWYASRSSQTENGLPQESKADACTPELRDELFSRVISFFGDKNFADLENAFVVVVGLGGVGSHCANMLIRSGVRRMRVIDFDQVTLSSLNRHAVANMKDVGLSKAEVMCRHFKNIVPWCDVEAVTEMFRGEDAERLLDGAPDFVLDCIDDVHTKAELIAHCTKRGIRVLTSMGAGGKADPTSIRIGPLSECVKDPLATKIRWKLKHHDVSAEDVLAVYSIEKPVCNLLPLSDQQAQDPQEFGAVEHLRLRVIPVLGTSPAIFGQTMASYVLCQLGGKAFNPESGERLSKNVRHKMRQILTNSEKKRYGSLDQVDLDESDIEFVVSQVWMTRCAVTGRRIGGQSLMVIVRWDPSQPPTPFNLVLVQQSVAAQIEACPSGGRGVESFGRDVVRRVESRLQWAKEVCDKEWPPSGQDYAGGGDVSRTGKCGRVSGCSACMDRIALTVGGVGLLGWLALVGLSLLKNRRI